MMKNKLIVLEGLSGAGKTTLAKHLEKKYNLSYFYVPTTGFKAARRYAHTTDRQTRFLFYTTVLSDASHQIKELLRKNHVIVDRFVHSTIAYHKDTGLPQGLFDILEKIDLVQPDSTWHVELTREMRYERLALRGEEPDEIAWEQERKRNKIAKDHFAEICDQTIFNNGDKLSLYKQGEELLDEIMSF